MYFGAGRLARRGMKMALLGKSTSAGSRGRSQLQPSHRCGGKIHMYVCTCDVPRCDVFHTPVSHPAEKGRRMMAAKCAVCEPLQSEKSQRKPKFKLILFFQPKLWDEPPSKKSRKLAFWAIFDPFFQQKKYVPKNYSGPARLRRAVKTLSPLDLGGGGVPAQLGAVGWKMVLACWIPQTLRSGCINTPVL